MVEARPVAPAYESLRKWPYGPVAEFPFFYLRMDFPRHAEYMLYSTAHWRPLINGYSDHIPPEFRAMVVPLSSFPNPESFAILKQLRAQYVVFHLNLYDRRAVVELKARIDEYREYLRPIRHRGPGVAVSDRRLAAGALAACLALAVLHTWPLAAGPASLSRHDNADAMLNEWIVAWVAHQAPRAPLHLFDANIFHPEPRSLAFSEHMTLQGLMGAPVLWLGGSPLLAYNLLVIAGLALSAWAMWLLLVRWTGSHAAGAVAGTLVAFNAHTLTRLPHLQALHLEFIPLVLLALDRLLVERRVRDAVLLGVACALQGLTSNYLLVFTATAAVAVIAVRAVEVLRPAPARTVALLGLAAVIAAAMLAPFLIPTTLRSASRASRAASTKWRATPLPGATTCRRPAACTTPHGAIASWRARRHCSRAWPRSGSPLSRSSRRPA